MEARSRSMHSNRYWDEGDRPPRTHRIPHAPGGFLHAATNLGWEKFGRFARIPAILWKCVPAAGTGRKTVAPA
jgi:hypothetical protein